MKRDNLTLAWRGATERVPDITFVEEVPPAALQVKVIAPAVQLVHAVPPLADDPVDLCLDMWKRWMAGDPDRDLGAKTMRGLSGEGDGHGMDLHEAQQASDMCIAQATNAMIDSLARLHVWAIYRACKIACG